MPENMRLTTVKAIRSQRRSVEMKGDITADLGAWLVAGGRLKSYYNTPYYISKLSNESLQEAALSTLNRMHISIFEKNGH